MSVILSTKLSSQWATTPDERRLESRSDPAHASLGATVDGARAQLLDVSRTGLSVRVSTRTATTTLPHKLSVELQQNDVTIARLAVDVTHTSTTGGATVLGGRIADSQIVASGRPPLPRSGDVVEVRDPELRACVLERLAAKAHRAAARFESGRSLEVRLGAAVSAPGALAIRSSTLGGSVTGQYVSIEVSHFRSRFVLEATVVSESDDECVLSAPHRVLSLSRRHSERVPVQPGTGFLRFSDALDPEHSIEVPILDLSPDGIAIELPRGCLLPPPPVPATIRVGEQRFRVLAEVHRIADRSPTSTLVGLRITPLRGEDLLRLARLCKSLRFPNLVQRSAVDREAVVELMKRSGYLALRDGTGPSMDWHATPGDGSLAIDTVYRADNGALLGHISCSRIYPQTWIVHQLATVGLRRARIAYPLYIQLMDWIALLATGEGYALAYFNQERTWHQALFGDFVRWVGSESLSLIASLDRFEPSSSPPAPAATLDGLIVRNARPEDLSFAVGLARSKLPSLLCDALHLREASVATPNLCDEHSAFGLERSRQTLVVEVHGEILGVAICETGAGHLSLFNLLNLAYVFFREPLAPSLARATQAALFTGVTDFYRARAGTQPLIVAPAGNAQFAAGAGLRRAEVMGVWTASLEGIKQWRNYIHFYLGELAERKRTRTDAGPTRSNDSPLTLLHECKGLD